MSLAGGSDAALLGRIGIALALGLLVGIQRGWAQREKASGTRFAGIRTYGLLGLAGGIAGALQAQAGALALVILVATAALVVIGYWRDTAGTNRISGTEGIAELLTMTCGFLAGIGELALASAAAGALVLILSLRARLHGLIAALDEREIAAIARFALIALVILPLLPDSPLGPYGAWRPRQLWLVVVLVSGFSLAGYLAAKRLGPSRGVLATAAAGSMVSSTAVTAALAGKLRDGEGDAAVLSAGVALASATMYLRVMLLTGALAPFALPTFALFALPGMAVSGAATLWLLRRRRDSDGADGTMPLRNPFALLPAVLLMLLVMGLTVAARWVLARFGDAGLALVLAISGTVDVDSAIITLGGLPASELAPRMAGVVLLAPIVLNTLFKAGALVALAGWANGRSGAVVLVASAAASLAALPFVL